jgi:hypothetical protein
MTATFPAFPANVARKKRNRRAGRSQSKKEGRVSGRAPFWLTASSLVYLQFGKYSKQILLSEYFARQPGQRAAGQCVLHDMFGALGVGPIHLLALDFQLQGTLDMAKFNDLAARH